MQSFDFVILEQRILECEECGWVGKGYETEKQYDQLPETMGICCPVCKNYLGEIKKK